MDQQCHSLLRQELSISQILRIHGNLSYEKQS
jgi:hypothetical protein